MNKNIVLPNMVDIFVNKKFEVEPFIDALQWLESKGLPSPVKKKTWMEKARCAPSGIFHQWQLLQCVVYRGFDGQRYKRLELAGEIPCIARIHPDRQSTPYHKRQHGRIDPGCSARGHISQWFCADG